MDCKTTLNQGSWRGGKRLGALALGLGIVLWACTGCDRKTSDDSSDARLALELAQAKTKLAEAERDKALAEAERAKAEAIAGGLALPAPGGDKARPTAPEAKGQPTSDHAAEATADGAIASENAKTSAQLGFYDQSGIRPIADDCKSASALLHVVPTTVHERQDFRWNFARQVMLANQQLDVQREIGSQHGQPTVAFSESAHTLTGGIGLTVTCSSGMVCNELAAAYKLVVPTSKPALFCGTPPSSLRQLHVLELVPWEQERIWDALPTRDEVVGLCVRLAACEAQETGELEGDPAIACQRRPSDFKTHCAMKKPCANVLSCVAE